MTHPSGLKVTSVSVLYHSAEDRLALITGLPGGVRISIMMTRRLTSRVVHALAQLLERTSAAARGVPAQAREDVIMFEHQGALAAKKPVTSHLTEDMQKILGIGKGKGARPLSILLDTVDVSLTEKLCVLTLKVAGGKPIARIDATRGDLHRFLALLHRRAEEADWNLSTEKNWLNLDQGPVTLN